jgi:hypothetical protein
MKGFLACILKLGIIIKPTIASYWSTICSQATPWFWKMFTKHIFSYLLRFFHVIDIEGLLGLWRTRLRSLCKARYQPPVEHADRAFRHRYNLHQEISVSEGLVGTKKQNQSHAVFAQQAPPLLGNQILEVVQLCARLLAGGLTYRGTRSQGNKDNIQKMAWGTPL